MEQEEFDVMYVTYSINFLWEHKSFALSSYRELFHRSVIILLDLNAAYF